jgi:Flp pilus assembly protein TadG
MIAGRLLELCRRFRRDDQAVAAVEFALVVPFLILLYVGSLEGGALFTADKRVNSISSTIGDLISQWEPEDGTISTSTLNGYFDAAQGLISPYSATGLQTVVSLVFVKSDGSTAKVMWSAAPSGQPTLTKGDTFAPLSSGNNPNTNAMARGGCVIASQTTYPYKPLLGMVFKDTITLSRTNYFIPRYGATNTIQIASTTIPSTACTDGKLS